MHFNVDDEGYITTVNTPISDKKPSDSAPYCIEVNADEGREIYEDIGNFKMTDGYLTNDVKRYKVILPDNIKKIAFLVDKEGYYIDVIYVDKYTDRAVKTPPIIKTDKLARWDFNAKQWTYEPRPKSREELLAEENSKLKQENEMTAIAMMELTESILGGK